MREYLKTQWRKAAAEAIGVFILLFAGCGSLAVAERFFEPMSRGTNHCVFGLSVAAIIYSLGHISGAHINPAVTLAFAIAKRFPLREVVIYWVAQFAGGFLAIALLWVLLPTGESFGATIPATGVTALQAVAWEVCLTFVLVLVIMSVATDTRAVGTMAGTAVGATVIFVSFLGAPVTGAALNPVRAIAPLVMQAEYGLIWIYFIGPVLGGVIAALVYEGIRGKPA